jgi:membrane-associated phospholipid phosphatase
MTPEGVMVNHHPRAWALLLFAALLSSPHPAEAQLPFHLNGDYFGVSAAPAPALPLAPPAEFVVPLAPQDPQTPASPPPKPHHTGFQALVRTTGGDFLAFPKRQSTWVILAVGAGAAAAAHPADDNVNVRLTGNRTVSRMFAPGKYIGLGAVQAGAAVGTYLVGRYLLPLETRDGEKTNKVSHLGFDLVRATIVTQVLTHSIKFAVQRERPDGSCCSFPSGHASATFATAAVLERHLGVRGAWPTMLLAGYVAASRLHDNRHFLSDVMFGAALGTAAGWTVVGRHGRTDYALMPAPIRGGMAIVLVHDSRSSHDK